MVVFTPHLERMLREADVISAYPDLLREKLARCGEPIRERNLHRCRSPACPVCRGLRGRAEGRRAVRFFDGAANERMALVTICSGVVGDLGEFGEANRRMAWGLRNAVAAQRRAWPGRWGGVSMYGWPEIDVIEASALAVMPLGLRAYVTAGRPAWNHDGIAWSVHWHMIFDSGRVDWQEVRDVLAGQFDLPHQVDVRPFHTGRSIDQNIMSIAKYSHTFKVGKEWNGITNWWPIGPTADYYMMMALNGWNGKRFMLKRKADRIAQNRNVDRKLYCGEPALFLI